MEGNEQISEETQPTEGAQDGKSQSAPPQRLYTEDEVKEYASRVVKERLARERAKLSKSEPQERIAQQAQASAVSDWSYDPEYFGDLLIDISKEYRLELDAEQRKMLRDDFKAVKPGDPTKWLRSRLSLGASRGPAAQATNEQPQTQQNTKQTTPAAGQANQAIPSAGAVEVSTEVPPYKWSKEQIARFLQTHGPVKGSQLIAKMNQEYRAQLMSGASNRR